MLIKELYIGRFAGLSDVKVKLTDGVNIIEGQNESGKSTLCAFIRFIFFGLAAKTKSSPIPDRRRYMPFDSQSVWGTMLIGDGEHDYIVSRTLTMRGKTACSDDFKITDSVTGAEYMHGHEPGEVFLGMSDALFDRTVYVSQKTGTAVDGTEVARAMENILFTAEESTDSDKALKIIDAARADILHKNGKGGKLFDAREEKRAMQREAAELKGASENGIAASCRLAELKEKAENNRRLTEQAQADMKRLTDARTLIRFEQHEKDRKRLAELEEKLFSLREGNIDNGRIHEMIKLAEALRAAERETEDARASAIRAEQNKKGIPNPELFLDAAGKTAAFNRKSGIMYAAGSILMLIGVVFAAFYAVTGKYGALIAAGAAALIIGISLAVTGALSRGKSKKILAEHGAKSPHDLRDRYSRAQSGRLLAEKEAAECTGRLDAAQSKLAGLTEQARGICDSLGQSYTNPDGLENTAARLTTMREMYLRASDEYSLLKAETDRAETELSAFDRAAIAEALKKDPHEVERELDASELERRITFGLDSSERQSKAIAEAERQSALLVHTVERERRVSERLSELDGTIEALEKRYNALVTAFTAIETAAARVKEHVSPRLAARSAELMSAATDGKYDSLFISDKLALSYTDPSRMTRDSEFFSRGTRDIAYICLRIALCELLTDGKTPMIFDESFANLDDQRLDRAYRVLSVRGAQSIVFTSHSRDAQISRDANIITL